ncbi:uncharacterized protein LOC131652966 [Vicia villosa]|uniref:uncharacterized protein LOC131652966 n=1 Tax=Vicia villosa TaxID=3911 RepID=UPI00273BF602|nr:uncharacterized protein LOC131652966 [Vicia villosa]
MKRKRACLQTPRDLYLDDDCWERIFKFIFDDDDNDNNASYFKSLSLVNKHFLSITNRLRFSLTLWNPTCRLLSRLFPRFLNLISLDLSCYHGAINNLLVRISCYPLKLTSLNLSNQPNIPARGLTSFSQTITTLTSLTCSNIASLSVADFLLISNCFPLLQELDLSVTKRIKVRLNASMSMLFPKLRKLNLYGHINKYMDDAWLLHFCKTSQFLQELVLVRCGFFTYQGIASAIRERPTLKSLSITCRSKHGNITSHFIHTILSLKDLTCLDLTFSRISDDLLSSIATRGLPLKKLVLHNCDGYSYAGIFCLLSKSPCIQHLNLQGSSFLNDQHVMNLSFFLGDLMSIDLSQCSMLSESSLLSLISNCLSLSEIKMNHTRIGNSFEDFVISPQLKSLNLAHSFQLRDESIKMFAFIFPNLELLDLSCCRNIYGEGICQVLRKCCKIKRLNLVGCLQLKLHGINFPVPKLKVLNLSYTSVDDETLYVIAKCCSGLLQLLLEGCDYVTKKGIVHVLKNCTQLKEINLENRKRKIYGGFLEYTDIEKFWIHGNKISLI